CDPVIRSRPAGSETYAAPCLVQNEQSQACGRNSSVRMAVVSSTRTLPQWQPPRGTRSIALDRQADVVVGHRLRRGLRARDVVELGELHLPAERPRLGEAVQQPGHPPGEAFGLPDAAQ